ncbi:DUF418 domain-containing protein [Rhodococcus erythropolis]|nr:DUF418 domain-containing protein [Rhodococcus erythropolis]
MTASRKPTTDTDSENPLHNRIFEKTTIDSRISGLDLARALAILGMFSQHFYSAAGRSVDWSTPSSWIGVVNNNSTILFALLAGVSKSLIDGGRYPGSGPRGLQARTNIMARALALFFISGVLVAFVSTPGSVLGYIAAGFVVSIPFLRVKPNRLFWWAGIGAVLLPYPIHVLKEVVYAHAETVPSDSSLDLLVTGLCPALIFLPVFMVGIALGRCDLRRLSIQLRLVAVGMAVTISSYLASWALATAFGKFEGTAWSTLGAFSAPDWRVEYNTTAPHLNGTLQMTVGIGLALTVIGLSLLLTSQPLIRHLLYPLRALGMCAFTAYIAQFLAVVLWFGTDSADYAPTNQFFLGLSLTLIVATSVWMSVFRRGPLEWILNSWARYMSRMVTTQHETQ